MKSLKKLGGIRIGSFNATIPFVLMKVYQDHITFTILFFKKIRIKKSDYIEIVRVNYFPIFGSGIQINLKFKARFGLSLIDSSKIIFWVIGNSKKLLVEIECIQNSKQ